MATDRVFRALADPTRRRILELLAKEGMTAGEIAKHFDMTFPSVSHHLAILRNAKLVSSVREGQHMHYLLNTTVFQSAVAHLMKMLDRSRR